MNTYTIVVLDTNNYRYNKVPWIITIIYRGAALLLGYNYWYGQTIIGTGAPDLVLAPLYNMKKNYLLSWVILCVVSLECDETAASRSLISEWQSLHQHSGEWCRRVEWFCVCTQNQGPLHGCIRTGFHTQCHFYVEQCLHNRHLYGSCWALPEHVKMSEKQKSNNMSTLSYGIIAYFSSY